MKRADYISWDQYFMGIALLSAERSKDPSTQVGACIVDDNNRIMSIASASAMFISTSPLAVLQVRLVFAESSLADT